MNSIRKINLMRINTGTLFKKNRGKIDSIILLQMKASKEQRNLCSLCSMLYMKRHSTSKKDLPLQAMSQQGPWYNQAIFRFFNNWHKWVTWQEKIGSERFQSLKRKVIDWCSFTWMWQNPIDLVFPRPIFLVQLFVSIWFAERYRSA